MTRLRSTYSPELQDEALLRIMNYFNVEGQLHSAASSIRRSYLANTMSALEVIEVLSRSLENHPQFLLLLAAKAFFPEYTFQCSSDPEDPIQAVTADGPRSLYQVAKEACLTDRQSIEGAKEPMIKLLAAHLQECSNRPYIVGVFNEITKDFKRGAYGVLGYMARIAILSGDFPPLFTSIGNRPAKGHVFKLLGSPDRPRPAVIYLDCDLTVELLSNDGCREVLAQIEYHRRLRAANNGSVVPSIDSVRRCRRSAAFLRRSGYTSVTPGSRGPRAFAHTAYSRTPRYRCQARIGNSPQASRTRFKTRRRISFRPDTSFASSSSRPQSRPCGVRHLP